MAAPFNNSVAEAMQLTTGDTPAGDVSPDTNHVSVADTPHTVDSTIECSTKRKYEEPSQVPRSKLAKDEAITGSTKRAKTVAGVHTDKLEPCGEPEVWSDKRAALNNAVAYFNSHQGSLHTTDLIPKGMLTDSIVGIRDQAKSQIIVTSVGGGRDLDPVTKKMVRTEDQGNYGKNIKSLKKGLAEKSPIVVILGAGNRNISVELQHYYNVLDYFHVTDIWQERNKGDKGQLVTVWMVRLEKIHLSKKSWWAPKGVSAYEAGEFEIGEYTCKSQTCTTCQSPSKGIFKQGWTCLNSQCLKYFELSTYWDVDELEYSDAFLRERTAYTGPEFKEELVPPLPSMDHNNIGSEKEYKQGIVCPKCRCCSRRIKWSGWFCENVNCDFEYAVPMKQAPIDNMLSENQQIDRSKTKGSDHVHGCIAVFEKIVGGQEFTTFFLPNEDETCIGTITRIRPTEAAISRKGGINDLYMQLQQEDLKLERRPAKNPGCRVEELTSHFSGNFGAPYKFGVVVKTTTSFQDAPSAILETLLRLTWGGKEAVETSINLIRDENIQVFENAIPSEFDQYNEQLVLGYFENSKISAHDDGEKELGPNVASLSLGSPSVMKFSPKKGKTIGDNNDLEKKKRKPLLSFTLKHGDMLIMHGEQIQKLYLHAVEPQGKHRFALTCRHIRPETIPDPEQRALSVVTGKVPDQWAQIKYDGKEDCFKSSATGEVAADVKTILGSG
ncbi:uncharacterized protein F4812DRAFT_465791 [Daldinia caldariorum]|uniref:uncharacterized protein n=1 Tax=Daldinia caldariorum TaxID=326644 RepID=UPI002008375F|nr:uncharacterized protein F4812DRAFT_465791 [Daldinia caldariorum]KAI1466558.1 hypothetical protein F4812DRAFT_465791 [Daldinia caldariorum]